MRRVHVALVALALVAGAVTSHSYSSYAKWGSSTATFYINPSSSDLSASAALAATQFALNVWNTQGASPFRFVYGGTSSVTNTANDGRNVVVFRNASNGGALASTYSWWDGSNRLIDSDVIVWEGSFAYFSGSSGCGGVSNAAYLEDVMTHEFGHALGLNHSSVGEATMYPSYGYCSLAMRTLASDDIAGIQALYGAGGGGGGGGAVTNPAITSPAAGATLGGSSQTFTWSAGSSITSYHLDLGTTAGGNNLLSLNVGLNLSHTATGLPTDGRTIYARLYYQRSGTWYFADTTYTAANSAAISGGGAGSTNPAITSPAAGSTLSGSSQAFKWSGGSGITLFYLDLGTSLGGNNLLNLNLGLSLGYTATGLPTDGRKIYARLWYLRSSGWGYVDTSYTAAGSVPAGGGDAGGGSTNPAMTSPAVGATLLASGQTFRWTAGTGVALFYLDLGTTPGGNNLLNQNMGTAVSYTAGTLPRDGRPIYARLWWRRTTTWEYADYSFRAATQ